jgi:hypothetical protein
MISGMKQKNQDYKELATIYVNEESRILFLDNQTHLIPYK